MDKWGKFVGLGLMYLWAGTFAAWLGWFDSPSTFRAVVGYVGFLLASASGVGAFLYMTALEKKCRRLEDTIKAKEG